MKNHLQPVLLPFICHKCGKIVIWTLPGASVYCKQCNTWISQPAKEVIITA